MPSPRRARKSKSRDVTHLATEKEAEGSSRFFCLNCSSCFVPQLKLYKFKLLLSLKNLFGLPRSNAFLQFVRAVQQIYSVLHIT